MRSATRSARQLLSEAEATTRMLTGAKRTLSAASSSATRSCVLMNKGRVDFDSKLSFAALASAGVEVTSFDADYSSAGDIAERARGAHILVTKEVPVRADAIAALDDSVELICEAGTGYNNIDLAAARAKGITVCNVPEYSTDAMAQLVITQLLNFSSGMCEQMRLLARGDRSNFASLRLVHDHFELAGKTVGLIGGNGAIGRRVSEIARCLGMTVLVSSRSSGVGLDELLAASDFVSIHCPLNEHTRGMLDASKLGRMKPTAFLINTARGAILDEAALLDALDGGRLAGAALDVQDPEPPLATSPLYSHEKIVLTPHIGWKRLETRQRLVDMVADNVAAYLRGAPVNVVS